jgi:transposase-like protein
VAKLKKNDAVKQHSEVSAEKLAPDPEVPERPIRRRFTAEYKRRILMEADACSAGEVGQLVRREGLYSSYLTSWRRQREQGELESLTSKRRGRKAKPRMVSVKEHDRVRRENDRLKRKLEQAELIIDIQKKASEILGIPLRSLDDDESVS